MCGFGKRVSYCDRDHTALEHEAATNHYVHVVVCVYIWLLLCCYVYKCAKNTFMCNVILELICYKVTMIKLLPSVL